VDFPGWALSPPTVRAFNGLYYATHGDADRIVDWESFFYPLDAVRHWNRIYGRRGFAQFQALFPDATAEAGLSQVLERIGAAGAASFLAVLKRSGAAGPAPLSFLFRGWTLALDLPNTGEPLVRLLADLEGILLRHGGRIYLAKDAVCTRDAFATMYPRLAEWRAVKARIDPRCRLRTRQSDRIGLTP
jgi:FAD/FMN-containing dehydrogenase